MPTDLLEIWKYRHLLRMLVVRDLKTRYKNSIFGIAWSFLQPLGMMIVLTFAFGIINRGPSDLPDFNVFILSGYLAWTFFSAAVVGGTGSVLANGPLVKKVYFPRIILPISVVLSNLINYILALPMFIIVALVSNHPLHWTLALVPFAMLIQVVFCVGLSFFLSAINVFYRDTQFIIDLAMLAWFFLTPIFYDIQTAQPIHAFGQTIDTALWLRRLNPMASLVNIYQDLMYRGVATNVDFWIRTTITSVIVLLLGYFFFQKLSGRFGEEL
ncbi:MAG: ABC transporter permease [Chloroflexi bacterium]|nr:ABC transporter permease [Chloroflexota bacterium]MCL5273702.1 ABC transporter permease [Chloroflexota bacterium]